MCVPPDELIYGPQPPDDEMPTPAELQAMRALAEKATPGPWLWDEPLVDEPDDGFFHRSAPWLVAEPYTPILRGQIEGSPENAAFIAAANPQAVIALLDALESARAALREIASWDVAFPEQQKGYGTRALMIARGAIPEMDARAHLGGQP